MKSSSKHILTSCLFALPVIADAQVVKFPMEVTPAGTIEETVSGTSSAVNGATAPVVADGAKGKAWRLDGYSSYAKATIDPAKFDGQEQVTLSLWVAPESYPMMRIDEDGEWFTTIVGNQNAATSGDKGFAFTLGNRGTYGFSCYIKGFKVEITASEKLARYQWNHLVVTVDGTNGKCITMYNNGKQVATKKTGATKGFNGGGSELYIGKAPAEQQSGYFHLNTFNGLIDDFEIYTGIESDLINATCTDAPQLAYSANRYAGDILRPAFHAMPSAGWTNETHGAVYYNGKYHVFFQKNPNGPYMARLNWGHITSTNLYAWQEERTAISPAESYDLKGCWSGCVFTDDELTGGKPNIFYTGVDYAKAMIAQAQPADDDLLVWNKMADNPVINGKPGGLSDDFRDCYVFRNGDNVYMIVGTSKNGVGAATLHKYNKTTGTWSNNEGDIFFSGANASQAGTFWEMPNMTQMGDKWLFTVTPQNTASGVRTLYWTGTVNSDGTFKADSNTPKTVEMAGFTKDGYGLLSPTIFKKDDKVLMLGIVPDKLASEHNYKLGYAHTYSLPREIALDANGNLVQKPYSGLTAMRTAASFEKTDITLNGSQDLSPVEGRSMEMSATFTAGSSDFGFTFFGDGSKQATLTYSPATGSVRLDASGISRIVQDNAFGGVYQQTVGAVASGNEVKLTAYVDHSIVDIFVNDTYAASVRVFPTDESAVKATAFASGETKVKSLKAYILDASASDGKGDGTGIGNVTEGTAGPCSMYCIDGTLYYDMPAEGCSLAVYDTLGRKLQEATGLASTGSLPLSAKGVLIVKTLGADRTPVVTKKIVNRR